MSKKRNIHNNPKQSDMLQDYWAKRLVECLGHSDSNGMTRLYMALRQKSANDPFSENQDIQNQINE